MVDKNRMITGEKLRGARKVRRIPVKVVPTKKVQKKPDWILLPIGSCVTSLTRRGYCGTGDLIAEPRVPHTTVGVVCGA